MHVGGPFDTSDEDESLCQLKKCLPNQSECASPSGTGPICIDTEKFCDGTFHCVNDEYNEYCGKTNCPERNFLHPIQFFLIFFIHK